MAINVLLVEDNPTLAETVISYLGLDHIDCDYAASGPQGLELALRRPYETILLDINLPRMNGLDVCAALRKAGVQTPVLMLTARDTLADKLAGFDAGTDDYLIKPFEMSELVARVRALAKRRIAGGQRLQVHDLVLDLDAKTAHRAATPLNLTPTGWKILTVLMRESPNVVSRAQLEQEIWSDADLPDTDTLKVHLYRLRQQVDKPYATPLLHTVATHGFVVRMQAPSSEPGPGGERD